MYWSQEPERPINVDCLLQSFWLKLMGTRVSALSSSAGVLHLVVQLAINGFTRVLSEIWRPSIRGASLASPSRSRRS